MAYQLYTSLITALSLIINVEHLPFREHSFIWSHSLAAESRSYCVEQYNRLIISQCPPKWFLQSFQWGPMRLAFSIVTRYKAFQKSWIDSITQIIRHCHERSVSQKYWAMHKRTCLRNHLFHHNVNSAIILRCSQNLFTLIFQLHKEHRMSKTGLHQWDENADSKCIQKCMRSALYRPLGY